MSKEDLSKKSRAELLTRIHELEASIDNAERELVKAKKIAGKKPPSQANS